MTNIVQNLALEPLRNPCPRFVLSPQMSWLADLVSASGFASRHRVMMLQNNVNNLKTVSAFDSTLLFLAIIISFPPPSLWGNRGDTRTDWGNIILLSVIPFYFKENSICCFLFPFPCIISLRCCSELNISVKLLSWSLWDVFFLLFLFSFLFSAPGQIWCW